MKRDELLAGGVLFVFGLITFSLSLKMPIGKFRMPGTGMFPLILGILLMLLSSLFILRLFYQSKKTVLEKGLGPLSQLFPIQLILFFGTMVLATAFFKQLGYPLTSFLLMMVLLRTLRMKNWGFILLLSLVTAGVSYFLFVQWLKIPLPKGWIGL